MLWQWGGCYGNVGLLWGWEASMGGCYEGLLWGWGVATATGGFYWGLLRGWGVSMGGGKGDLWRWERLLWRWRDSQQHKLLCKTGWANQNGASCYSNGLGQSERRRLLWERRRGEAERR